jgi:segregation and condensation protein B
MQKLPEEKQAYTGVIEALLFSSDTPLTIAKIREILPDLLPQDIKIIIDHLNEQYRTTRRSFEIRPIAGGYQIFNLAEYAAYIDRLNQSKQKTRLSQKALETMAIVAYKQPVTKHEIEEIRGVNADGVIKTLLSRNLITISGRAKAPGGPFLYNTTKKFLDYFGLEKLEDLPKLKEIDELIDVDEDGIPFHETILREIHLGELGLQSEQDRNNDDVNHNENFSNGHKEGQAQ